MLPLPTSLSTHSRPPILCTSCDEMASPSPVPPYLRVVEASSCENALNRLSILFSAQTAWIFCEFLGAGGLRRTDGGGDTCSVRAACRWVCRVFFAAAAGEGNVQRVIVPRGKYTYGEAS